MTQKPVIGAQEMKKAAVINAVAKTALDGNLTLEDFANFKNQDDQKWGLLKVVNLLDIYKAMRSLENPLQTTSETTTTNETLEKESKMTIETPLTPETPETPVTPVNVETSEAPKPTRKRKTKISDEDAKLYADAILALEPLNTVGGKMSKKQLIAQESTLNEDQITAGLNEARGQGKLTAGRGRNAQWTRVA